MKNQKAIGFQDIKNKIDKVLEEKNQEDMRSLSISQTSAKIMRKNSSVLRE